MQIELSERELEILIHMLTEFVTKADDGELRLNLSMDELVLLDKLDQSLKIEKINSGKPTSRKYLN